MPDVRQLLPVPAEIDPAAGHAGAHRPRPADRPWFLVNMVASVDGATAVDGTSGALGGPADKVVFSAIRAVADVIVVAAGTVRAESYGPPRPSAARRAEREARGQSPAPRLAVVTRSLDLDPGAALFADGAEAPLVYTVTGAPADRRGALAGCAEIHDLGGDAVDLGAMASDLHRRGAAIVVIEGGPGLNGQFVAAGLVDEVNVTVAPLLVGGDSARLAYGPSRAAPTDLDVAHLWEAEGLLFVRYLRR